MMKEATLKDPIVELGVFWLVKLPLITEGFKFMPCILKEFLMPAQAPV